MPHTTILHPAPTVPGELHRELTIPFIEEDPSGKLQAFSHILDALPAQPILNLSWPEYATNCRAWFRMVYTPQAFVLKYDIQNDFFQSTPRATNGPVHLDNCIEFFVQFGDDTSYYNIEFNCLGNGKMAYGEGNTNRHFVSPALVNRISTWVQSEQVKDRFNWEMILIIPVQVFEFHQLTLNSALQCRANFYKCGDLLPQPHFLTWNKITASHPNFHSPEAFGTIHLDKAAENNFLL